MQITYIKVKMLQILLGDKTVDIVANVYRVKRVTQPKTLWKLPLFKEFMHT